MKTEPGIIKFYWDCRGLKGFLCSSKSHKLKFYFNDGKRKLFYPDLIGMSASAHAFAIKSRMTCLYASVYINSLRKEQQIFYHNIAY